MYVIGIDLSINYPAMCICENFEKIEYVGFVNNPRMSGVNLQYVLSETAGFDGVDVVNIAEERKTTDVYYKNERIKLLNFHRIIGAMLMEIRKRVDSNNIILAMEGISYGSSGSSLVDICMLTGAFRKAVLSELLCNDANRLFVFSPSELKNAMGLRGTATKTEVLAQFLESPGIDAAKNNGLHLFMENRIPPSLGHSEYVYNTKKDEVGSPFNDMIDAYLNVLKIRQVVS